MKKSLIIIVVIIGICFTSCKKNDSDFIKTELGFSFKRCTKHDSAPKAKVGDILYGEMKILLNNKTLISSNYGSPDRLFKIANPRVGSIDEFLLTLHMGDSVIMVAPADSVAKYISGIEARPNDKIYFYLTISQIISQRELTGHDKEVADKQKLEEDLLTDFVLRKYTRAEKKESGLFYLNLYEGVGKKAEYGKRVYVNYYVTDTAGKIYDSNIKDIAIKGGIYHKEIAYKPFDFILGDDALIAGWNEGVSYMRVGGHCKLVIPSRLAYGELGFSSIPPYTPLVFDITLVKQADN
jgi:FKBP-type peptidyl-prolyl cis-trans isomerase FkpA